MSFCLSGTVVHQLNFPRTGLKLKWAKVLQHQPSEAVSWIIPVFTSDGSHTKQTKTMVDHSLKPTCLLEMQPWTIFSPLMLLVSPRCVPWACCLMLMLYFALGIYDCKGPLVAGCVAHARVQHTQCVLISCITNDSGSGFQINRHKGFLDLTVLHIRKVWTLKTLTTKCFKTIIIKRLFYFWLNYKVNISNNSSWHASPHPCLTWNQTIKQL